MIVERTLSDSLAIEVILTAASKATDQANKLHISRQSRTLTV